VEGDLGESKEHIISQGGGRGRVHDLSHLLLLNRDIALCFPKPSIGAHGESFIDLVPAGAGKSL